jgi:hypothetical protein
MRCTSGSRSQGGREVRRHPNSYPNFQDVESIRTIGPSSEAIGFHVPFARKLARVPPEDHSIRLLFRAAKEFDLEQHLLQ